MRLPGVLRPAVALYRDVPWCQLRRPHRPDAVGQLLVVFGVLEVFYGLSLAGDFPSERTVAGLAVAIELLPLSAWSWLWVVTGALCVGSAFFVGDQPGVVGFVSAWAPWFGWACWYTAGVVAGAPGRGIVLAVIFLAVAVIGLRCSTLVDAGRLPRRDHA